MDVLTPQHRSDRTVGGLTRLRCYRQRIAPCFWKTQVLWLQSIIFICFFHLFIYGKRGFAGCDIVGCGTSLWHHIVLFCKLQVDLSRWTHWFLLDRASCSSASLLWFYPEHRAAVLAHLFCQPWASGWQPAEDSRTWWLQPDFLPLIISVSAALQMEGREGGEGEVGEESNGQKSRGERSMKLTSLK